MTKVTFDISMSLDGYIRAANPTPDEPLGAGGEQLHTWAFGEDERDRAVLEGGKDVTVMGGADVGRQFLRAGLVDELSLHVVPVVFGGGTRLFGDDPAERVQLEALSAIQTPSATHLTYRIVR